MTHLKSALTYTYNNFLQRSGTVCLPMAHLGVPGVLHEAVPVEVIHRVDEDGEKVLDQVALGERDGQQQPALLLLE